MKKFSGKKIATALVAVVTCAVIAFGAFILFHNDKPIYTPEVNWHSLDEGSQVDDYSLVKFTVGPDITGKKYDIKVLKSVGEEGSELTFISIDDGKKQKVETAQGDSGDLFNVCSMIDENGKAVIVVNMDVMSDDYVFVVYTIKDGRLVNCGSDYAMIEKAETDRTFTASYQVDFIGTWFGQKTIKLTDHDNIQIPSGDYTLPEDKDRQLTVKKNLKVEMLNDEGKYKSATLKKGRKITLYATDGESYALFTDENGKRGRIKGEKKDGLVQISGKNDMYWLDGVHYAG